MLFEESCNRDSVSALEERSLLQQIVSFGVGYPYGRSGLSKAAISDTDTLHREISRILSSQKYSDAGNIICDAKDRIRNGDDGYYFFDLDKGRILAGGQHPIEDIIIDFTLPGADDRVLLRRRKGTCLHSIGFLIVPDAVNFLWMNRVCVPLKEFHMLSFITVDDSRSGLVVDYDAAQHNTTGQWYFFHVKKTSTSYKPSWIMMTTAGQRNTSHSLGTFDLTRKMYRRMIKCSSKIMLKRL